MLNTDYNDALYRKKRNSWWDNRRVEAPPISYTKTQDGVRIAYWTLGEQYSVVGGEAAVV